MSLSGEIGGLLGSMIGKAAQPLFFCMAASVGFFGYHGNRLPAIAVTFLVFVIEIVVVWGSWHRLGIQGQEAISLALFNLFIWYLWASIIYGFFALVPKK